MHFIGLQKRHTGLIWGKSNPVARSYWYSAIQFLKNIAMAARTSKSCNFLFGRILPIGIKIACARGPRNLS
jgi:hypothetical protein